MRLAFERLLDHLGAAFRPERDEHQTNILTACRLKELVQSHRMTFQQAMEKLDARRGRKVCEAMRGLVEEAQHEIEEQDGSSTILKKRQHRQRAIINKPYFSTKSIFMAYEA